MWEYNTQSQQWTIVFQIEEHVLVLQATYKDLLAQKQLLANRKTLATRRLHCASILLATLKDEKAWLSLALYPLHQFLQGLASPRMGISLKVVSRTYLLRLSSHPVCFTEMLLIKIKESWSSSLKTEGTDHVDQTLLPLAPKASVPLSDEVHRICYVMSPPCPVQGQPQLNAQNKGGWKGGDVIREKNIF